MNNADQPQSGSALLLILLTVLSLACGAAVTVPGIVFPEESLLLKES